MTASVTMNLISCLSPKKIGHCFTTCGTFSTFGIPIPLPSPIFTPLLPAILPEVPTNGVLCEVAYCAL